MTFDEYWAANVDSDTKPGSLMAGVRETAQKAWQAALQQPAQVAEPSITLNGYQLKEALEFAWPDGDKDMDQGETELTIQHMPERVAVDGELMVAGMYAYYSEMPEEGCMLLSEEPAAAPIAAVPEGYVLDLLGRAYAKLIKYGVENTDPLLMDELKLELMK